MVGHRDLDLGSFLVLKERDGNGLVPITCIFEEISSETIFK